MRSTDPPAPSHAQEGTTRQSRRVAGWKLVGVAVLLQVALLWDVGAYFLTDALVPGRLTDFPFADASAMAVNRLLVIAPWALAVGAVYYWSRSKGLLGRMFTWRYDPAVLGASLAAVCLHVLDNVVMSTLGTEALAPRGIGEHALFVAAYGPVEGNVVFALQALYYLVEALIVLFMLGLFQRAGERRRDGDYLPWGGIGLALTWGALHALMSPSLEMLVLPLAMGVVYVAGRRHVVPAYLAVVLAFFV